MRFQLYPKIEEIIKVRHLTKIFQVPVKQPALKLLFIPKTKSVDDTDVRSVPLDEIMEDMFREGTTSEVVQSD